MSLPHILLGLLREPATGHDLKREFTEGVGHFWSAELAQIYPTLKRLERDGLLESHWEPSPKGSRRRVYERTAAGRDELLAWLTSGPQLGTERFAYLAQLFFLDELGDIAESIAYRRALSERPGGWLEALTGIEAEVLDCGGGNADNLPDDELHRYATLRMGLHSLTAKVAWCDETITLLERRATANGESS